jgi:hypothetical protein
MDKRLAMLAAIDGGGMYAADRTRADVYVNDRDDSSLLLRARQSLGLRHIRPDRRSPRLARRRTPMATARRTDSSQPVFAIRTLEHPLESATSDTLASARIVSSSGTEVTVYKDRLQRFLADQGYARSYGGLCSGPRVGACDARGRPPLRIRDTESDLVARRLQGDGVPQTGLAQLDIELIHRGLAVQRATRRSGPVVVAESGAPAIFSLSKDSTLLL